MHWWECQYTGFQWKIWIGLEFFTLLFWYSETSYYFIFNTKRPTSSVFFGEVLEKSWTMSLDNVGLGVSLSGPGTSSTSNHIFYKVLGWLRGWWCKQSLKLKHKHGMVHKMDFVGGIWALRAYPSQLGIHRWVGYGKACTQELKQWRLFTTKLDHVLNSRHHSRFNSTTTVNTFGKGVCLGVDLGTCTKKRLKFRSDWSMYSRFSTILGRVFNHY